MLIATGITKNKQGLYILFILTVISVFTAEKSFYDIFFQNDRKEMLENSILVSNSNEEVNNISLKIDEIINTKKKTQILLEPGEYKEVIDLRANKFVNIVGLPNKTTKIIDKTGDYYSSPLNISGDGYFKNLTFVANHDEVNGVMPEITSYAVHIDWAGEGDLLFENSTFISYQNSAVGIGMHQSQTITFKDCIFYTNSDYGASVYAHNNVSSGVTDQLLIFENCLFISEKGDSLRLDDSNIIFDDGLGNDMTVKFINNYFYSKEKKRGTFFAFNKPIGKETLSGRIKLDQSSSGNNIPELNAN